MFTVKDEKYREIFHLVSTTTNRYKRYERWRDSRGREGCEVRQEDKIRSAMMKSRQQGKKRERERDHCAFRGETHGSRAVG